MNKRFYSGIVSLAVGVASGACGTSAGETATSTAIDLPVSTSAAATMNAADKSENTVSDSENRPLIQSSYIPTPVSDFTPSGDPAAQTSINFPGILVSGSRVPLTVAYDEDPAGGTFVYVSYHAQDVEGTTRFELNSPIELDTPRVLDSNGPVLQLAMNGVERKLIAGSMLLTFSEGRLRYDFTGLVFEGVAGPVSGSVSGVPIENCRPLVVSPSNGVTSTVGEIVRVHQVDPSWSSEFCSQVPRLFP